MMNIEQLKMEIFAAESRGGDSILLPQEDVSQGTLDKLANTYTVEKSGKYFGISWEGKAE